MTRKELVRLEWLTAVGSDTRGPVSLCELVADMMSGEGETASVLSLDSSICTASQLQDALSTLSQD